jgi:flagellar hook-basal body complex protein FliE
MQREGLEIPARFDHQEGRYRPKVSARPVSGASSGAAVDLVKLKPFDFAQAVAKAGMRQDVAKLGQAESKTGGPSFANAIDQALKTVSRSQVEATRMQREVQLDNPTVSLEETMVAMQKAQLGFQATLQVRNRLVQAYSDIMNMQV